MRDIQFHTVRRALMQPFVLHIVLPIVLFWLILWSLGFPPPSVDDLFFVGTADHLFKTGELVNPLLRFWTDRAVDHYYLHTPIYPYTLAAWFVLFGINTQSLLLFQCVCAIAVSIATAAILQHYGFSKLACLLTPILYSTVWLSNSGLRHDGFGMALLAIGLWFLIQTNRWATIGGFCCVGLSALVYPQLIAYGIPFTGGILMERWHNLKQQIKPQTFIRQTVIDLITAVIIVGLLFLALIQFDIQRFLADFLWHSSLSRSEFDQFFSIQGSIALITHYLQLGYNAIIFGGLYLLYLTCIIYLCLARKQQSASLIGVTISIFLGLCLNLLIYSNNWLYGSLDFFVWLSVLLILTESQQLLFYGVAIAVFLIYQSTAIISVIGQEQTPASDYQAIHQELQAVTDKIIVIDSVTARFVLDYQIPENSIDYIFYGPAPKFIPEQLAQKKENELWMVGRRNVLFMELSDEQTVHLFGHQFGSIMRWPNEVIVFQ